MKRIVFLDIDGVLNNINKKHKAFHSIAPSGVKGLFDAKLKLFNKFQEKVSFQVILSSSWQDDVINNTDDGKFLVSELSKYGIKINGFTNPVKHNLFDDDFNELRGKAIKLFFRKRKGACEFRNT